MRVSNNLVDYMQKDQHNLVKCSEEEIAQVINILGSSSKINSFGHHELDVYKSQVVNNKIFLKLTFKANLFYTHDSFYNNIIKFSNINKAMY